MCSLYCQCTQQDTLNYTIIALVLNTHVIRRLTYGITIMCITHGFMDGLGNLNGFTNPIISPTQKLVAHRLQSIFLQISVPVAVHHCNVYRINSLHNIPPLLPPSNHALSSRRQTTFFQKHWGRERKKAVWLCKTNHACVQNSWHLLEYKLLKTIPTL